MKKLKKKSNENLYKGLELSSLRVALVLSAKARTNNLNLNQDQKDQKVKKRKSQSARAGLQAYGWGAGQGLHLLYLRQRKRKRALKLDNTRRKKSHPKETHLISRDLQVKKGSRMIHLMIHQTSRTG